MSINRATFFSRLKPLFPVLKQSQVDGINAILNEWERRGFRDRRWLAYVLATVYHETGKRMQPVKEFGGEAYLRSKKYYPYYGRDLVQTTWRWNYQKVKDFTGVDVVSNPDLITTLAPAVAIEFMNQGWYTGKKLADYFSETSEDWRNARRIINGIDKAELVGEYGREFYQALV